jgi:hypothetical protein
MFVGTTLRDHDLIIPLHSERSKRSKRSDQTIPNEEENIESEF